MPSGIPDFRSPDVGLWSRDDPMEIASLSGFRRNPQRFYRWLFPLLQSSLNAIPNPAHISIAHFEKTGKSLGVVTQNIDGLHQRAGSQTVVELHGSLESSTCQSCRRKITLQDLFTMLQKGQEVPKCPVCGGVIKPDITFFEEALPEKAWNKAQHMIDETDLVVVCGSSLEVYPAAALPERAASKGARLIVINRDATPMDEDAAVVIHADLAGVLPELLEEKT